MIAIRAFAAQPLRGTLAFSVDNPNRTAEYFSRRDERIAALTEELRILYASKGTKTLEVGCGHGHFLTHYADAHPNELCVGIDIVLDRVERAHRKRNRAALDNLFFIRAEAWEFFQALPAETRFTKFFVLFPDPWPKRRHQKNRLLQESFLTELAKRSEPGARLHFRTDDDAYFAEAMSVVKNHPDWSQKTDIDWPFEYETVFQARARSFQSLIAQHQQVG